MRTSIGSLYDISRRTLGERFSCITFGNYEKQDSAVVQALHEFESKYGVTVGHFQVVINRVSEVVLYMQHSKMRHPDVRLPL